MDTQPITAAAPDLLTLLRAGLGPRSTYLKVTEAGAAEGHRDFVVSNVQPAPAGAVTISKMERHPHASQSFIPLDSGRWLVVIAPTAADGGPDMTRCTAFVAGPTDAVCIHRNTWHSTLLVLDRPAEMAMTMWRATTGGDTEYGVLPNPLTLTVPPV